MKKCLLILSVQLVAAVLGASYVMANTEKPHVYINPGHGGHDSDDRNVATPNFAAGDTSGFWESNASLKKGIALKQILEKKGYTTSISRVTNTSESDLDLSTIVELCNQSGADVFYAIHSNATGAGEGYRINYPIGLYRGYTGQPEIAGSDSLTACLGPYLLANKSTVWSNENYYMYGDWTFYPQWGYHVGLGVLRGNKAVSMLDEGSFHDYIPEAERLINPDYCWVEGWNFSLGADKFFNRLDKFDLGIVTGNIRDDRVIRNGNYVKLGDDNRVPVDGARVQLLDVSGNVVQSTTTDSLDDGIYLFKYVEPGKYTVAVSDSSHFSMTKEVTVAANAPVYCNFDLKRVRNTAPRVLSYSPVWHENDAAVKCNTPVVLQFNWDMDTESTQQAFSISPAVEGTFTWEDTNYRMVFTPTDAYDTNTVYTVTLHKSARHGGGTPMDSDFTFQFRTQDRNHIYPLAVFPYEGAQVHYKAGQYVEFRTDSMLNAYNIASYFHVYDKDGNELSYNKRNVKYGKRGDDYGYCRLSLLKALTPGESYRLVVDKALSDTAGLHLENQESCNFTAVDAGEAKSGTVVDDFESTANYNVMLTDCVGSPSGTVSASSDKLFGSHSLQFAYQFYPDTTACYARQIVIEYQEPAAITFTHGDEIGVHINGDMSYNTLYAFFEPVGTTAQSPWVRVALSKIDYHGWHYATARTDSLEAGVAYRLSGLQLVKNDSKMGYSGTIKIDNLLKLPSTAVNSITAGKSLVKVGPVPASDYIVASADGFIDGVELVNAAGQLVARNAANFVNVSNVAPGVYFLRVYMAGRATTHKVIVKH